ncbi:hypothetical protein [Bartonella kosoyi]|uniref:hypothetical protein n=1 Tax=Bartonella kosoyi TaxID=2133959 RepID=UPI003CC7D57A
MINSANQVAGNKFFPLIKIASPFLKPRMILVALSCASFSEKIHKWTSSGAREVLDFLKSFLLMKKDINLPPLKKVLRLTYPFLQVFDVCEQIQTDFSDFLKSQSHLGAIPFISELKSISEKRT